MNTPNPSDLRKAANLLPHSMFATSAWLRAKADEKELRDAAKFAGVTVARLKSAVSSAAYPLNPLPPVHQGVEP